MEKRSPLRYGRERVRKNESITPQKESSHREAALLEKVPVSDLCQNWACGRRCSAVAEGGSSRGRGSLSGAGASHRQVEEKQERIGFLEKKVQTKDEGWPS